jgi:hypothetical protein
MAAIGRKNGFSIRHPSEISGHNLMLGSSLRQEFDAGRKIILSQSHLYRSSLRIGAVT